MTVFTRISKYIFISGLFLLTLNSRAFADKVYLKNGNVFEGIIKSESGGQIEIEVCAGGSIKLDKASVVSIEKTSEENKLSLRNRWESQKSDFEGRLQKQAIQEEFKPKEVEFAEGTNNIIVEVTLNKKVKAFFVLDTGASVVLLSKKTAQKLGVDLTAKPDCKMTVADGRKVDALHISLNSVELQGQEAKNVDAVVLLEDLHDDMMKDGLLGMSFLNRFNFKIDRKEKKLVLEKIQ